MGDKLHIIAAILALALAAAFGYWLFLAPGNPRDLAEWERFGGNPRPGSEEEATSTESAPSFALKDYRNDGQGIAFRYPEYFEAEPDGREVSLVGSEYEVRVVSGCIRTPEAVPELGWETEFSRADSIPTTLFRLFEPVPIRELRPGGIPLFAIDISCYECQAEASGERPKGFAAAACVSGANRRGFTAGKCLEINTSLEDPAGENYRRLQAYFLNQLLPSLEILPSFRDVSACPGLEETDSPGVG